MADTEMKFRKAVSTDRPQIIKLWETVFGDSEAVAGRILDDFAGLDNIYLAESNGNSIAHLLAVPCEAGGHTGAYLYGLATNPEYRSKGIMGGLMEYARKQIDRAGGSFFVLIPASKSLFNYYEMHGFDDILMTNAELNITDTPKDDFDSGEIPTQLFMNLRKKYLGENVVSFSKDRTAFELEEQWYYDCKSKYCKDGYVIYLKVEDTLFVTEIAAESQDLAKKLISSAMHQTNSTSVKIALPEDSDFFSDMRNKLVKTPQGQFKWWGIGSPPKFYLRYALDDLPARLLSNHDDIIT